MTQFLGREIEWQHRLRLQGRLSQIFYIFQIFEFFIFKLKLDVTLPLLHWLILDFAPLFQDITLDYFPFYKQHELNNHKWTVKDDRD